MREEIEWREKLRFEFECEDFYLRDESEQFRSESKYESYDDWAERIQSERTGRDR